MFDKQARFWVGEFDGEKECAAGNEVSAITRHRIFVCGLGVGEGMVCFEVPCNSQVGCVAQPRTRCWVCRIWLVTIVYAIFFLTIYIEL